MSKKTGVRSSLTGMEDEMEKERGEEREREN
jgi:hypothetical protein